jgi:hypothetical protein
MLSMSDHTAGRSRGLLWDHSGADRAEEVAGCAEAGDARSDGVCSGSA